MYCVYRHFDKYGNLLYVGMSVDPHQRLRGHKTSSHWYADIDRMDVERIGTRQEARKAEILAIESEKPLHNIQRTPSVPLMIITCRFSPELYSNIVESAQKSQLPINTYLVQLLTINVKGA